MQSTDFLDNWNALNEVTLDILKSIPENQYTARPFNHRFRSFAWEFACLVTTRQMYVNGFTIGKINTDSISESEESVQGLKKEEVKEKLSESSKAIRAIIRNKRIDTVDFFGKKTAKLSVISWLLQHEQLHFGKLVLYLAKAELLIPKSLQAMWGEGSFPQK